MIIDKQDARDEDYTDKRGKMHYTQLGDAAVNSEE